jgi:hypothetical protein
MLNKGGHSGLVRLSDSLKTTLSLCARSSWDLLQLVAPQLSAYRESQRLAGEALAGDIDQSEANSRIREILATIPDEVSHKAEYLQGHEIHTLSLSAILLSCFCLESYSNTLADFLSQNADFPRMRIREKWKTLGTLRNAKGFDQSRPPFQDFHILFRFRDDHVHDKVIAWGSENAKNPYNGKLPVAAFGPLDLGHALWAAETYWGMVQEVHRLTAVPETDFHRHYNLRPWLDEGHHEELRRIATAYRKAGEPP